MAGKSFISPTQHEDEEEGKTEVQVMPPKNTKKKAKPPAIPPKPMTDEEYEDIFSAVLATSPDEDKEADSIPAVGETTEDDFDAILHEDAACDLKDVKEDCKAEEEVETQKEEGAQEDEEEDEGAKEEDDEDEDEDELNVDDLPQDVRADVLQMTNELTPCTSDVEDDVKTPEAPPRMLHKKHGSSVKKQTLKPKQLKFNKNSQEEDTLEKSATTGDIECNASGNKSNKTQGNTDTTHKILGTVHKKMKVKTMDENDEKSKEAKARKKQIAHDKITRVTRDGFSSSQESVGTGDIKRRNKKTKKLSKRQIMQDRQLEEIGTWVQCTATFCMKWRYLSHVHDPASLPEHWDCHMNTDENYNRCNIPQQLFDQQEHDKEYVFMTYTEGSVVWARMDGYPWWPAMVEIDPDYEDFYECQGPLNKASHYHVVYFDDKVSRAWLSSERIKPFTDADELGKTNFRGVNHSKAVKAARTKALQALNMSLKDRLQTYSFSVRYGGKWAATSTKDDSQSSQDYGKSKKAAAWREDLDEMSSGEEENMMDGDDDMLYGFLPSEGEGDGEKEVMSDYAPEEKKPKKTKKKKEKENVSGEDGNVTVTSKTSKKTKEEKVAVEDNTANSSKKTKGEKSSDDNNTVTANSSKRKSNEGSSDKTCKKKKKSTTDKSSGSMEKTNVKVKADSSVVKPKVKPTFQAPKQEKTLKTKVAPTVAPELELDSDVFTMEMTCKDVEPAPKKKAVKKTVPKNDVANNEKENIDPKSKTTSVDKTVNKSKFVVKPKFSLSNNVKAMKTKTKDDSTKTKDDSTKTKDDSTKTKDDSTKTKDDSTKTKDDSTKTKDDSTKTKDDSTDVRSSQDNEHKTVATKKKKQFRIKKTSANDATSGQGTSDKKPAAKKTREEIKDASIDGEDIITKTTTSPNGVPSVDNGDLNIDIEDNLFPDLDLTSANIDARQDEDNDSDPFDMDEDEVITDGGDRVITEMITDVTNTDKLTSLNDEFDSQPMEFEE